MNVEGKLLEWRKSAPARVLEMRANLEGRRELLIAVLVVAMALLLLGGASARLVVLALLAVALWSALWPLKSSFSADDATSALDADRARRTWKQIVDGFPEAAVVLGPTGHVVHMNRGAEELVGSGKRGLHFTSFSRDPTLITAIDEGLERGSACVVELQERVPLQRRRSVSIAPLGDQAGKGSMEPALLVAMRDMTEQDRLARMRADFVANASHELRTPLAALKGFVETLQGAAKDDPTARDRFLQVMSEQADRMTRLIDDLLSLSRVEMREYLPPSENVDVEEALHDVVQSLEPIAERTGTQLRVAPAPPHPIVRGDRDELLQVFQNLIHNALKYGHPGGTVDLAITRSGNRIRVSVTDDGPGIPPQHLPRLTERFYRTNVAASRERGGTGLGLAIVKHILNRHKGTLEITSEVGKGSTFTANLPAIDEKSIKYNILNE